MSNFLERIKKTSKLEAKYIEEVFDKPKTLIPTPIRGFNLMLSGKYFGGYHSGITIYAAPSKHFKTNFLLVQMKAFLEANPEGIAVLYDTERGASRETFQAYDIDLSRVLWKPVMNLEEFKFDIVSLLKEEIKEGDKIFIGIDSIGNAASIKEVDDAIKESGAADMTRAKQLKSIFRMITPYLNKYDIPFVAINHVYDEIGLYPKQIMGGGQGPLLSADTVVFITKSKNKSDTDELTGVEGFNFTMRAEKSRFVREGAKCPITVSFEKGIDPKSGLLELGLMTKTIEKVGHRYRPVLFDRETGEVMDSVPIFKKEMTVAWFDEIATNQNSDFLSKVESYFAFGSSNLFDDNDVA